MNLTVYGKMQNLVVC